MKNLLLILGILLITTPFALLCLYALTPWEPYREAASGLAAFVSMLLGMMCVHESTITR
jgi:hypothetical protein